MPEQTAVAVQTKPEPGSALEVKAKTLGSQAGAITKIEDAKHYKLVNDLFLGCSAAIKEVVAFFAPIKADAYKAWQNNCAREKAITSPLETGKAHLGKLIIDFDAEAERQRKLEEDRQRAEYAKANEESVLAEAEALHAEGDVEGALNLIDQGVMSAPAITVNREIAKVKGVITRGTWKARLKGSSRNKNVDTPDMTQEEQAQFMLLVKAVAAGNVPIVALLPNWRYLSNQCRDTRKLTNIPGIEAWEDKSISGRT